MIVLFDGVCQLCQWSVQFIIAHDPDAKFRFGSLQDHPQHGGDSIVLLAGDKVYHESTAALHVAKHLSGAWKLLYVFIIVPRPLRDAVYRYIARNRYKWFGKHDSCPIPTPQLRARLIPSQQ